MVSDQQIASCVESLLSSGSSTAGAGDTSFATVLRSAEAKLGVDLSHKASFIRDQIDLLLGPRRPPLNPAPPPPPAPPPVEQPPPPQAVQLVQRPVPPVQVVQPPVQVTMPHPPPPAHLLFQPIPALQFINVGGGNMAAQMATGTTVPATGGTMQVGQVPAGSGVGEGVQLGQMGQVPVAFYPPPPLAYRFGTYQAVPGQQAVMVTPQPVVQVTGPHSTDVSKESGTGVAKRKRGGPGGLNKICGVSPELQKIVGETAMSRTQIVKMLWAYIRENNLQDPDDKRKIICNDQLKTLFDTDSTDMFKMNKLLSKHIIPLDSFELEARKRRAAEINAAKGEKAESSDQNSSSNSNSVLVSDELALFIGTEDKEMTRDDAVKHVLDYVKANHLEDDASATIVCDAKLKELLGCDSLPISGVRDMLFRHFIAES